MEATYEEQLGQLLLSHLLKPHCDQNTLRSNTLQSKHTNVQRVNLESLTHIIYQRAHYIKHGQYYNDSLFSINGWNNYRQKLGIKLL
jgi:hypothetical protein